MLKIYCVNSRCRLYHSDLDTEAVEPMPITCLSCRRTLKREVKLDMGHGVSMVGNAHKKLHTPELWSKASSEAFDTKDTHWGTSVLESVHNVNKILDDHCVETDRRVMPDMADDSALKPYDLDREPVGPEDADYLESIVEASKVLDEAEVSAAWAVLDPEKGIDIEEWMEKRDSIDKSMINLLEHSRNLGALHIESRLLELHRELLNVLSADVDDEDDENDDEFYALMP